MNKILFLCTGNYYRSRMAEEYFNFKATTETLPWRAESRALAKDLTDNGNVGSFSLHAHQLLQQHNIPIIARERMPLTLQPEALAQYAKIIAMSQQEHLPMVQRDWSDILEQIEFWEVGDIGVDTTDTAFLKVTSGVDELIALLMSASGKLK